MSGDVNIHYFIPFIRSRFVKGFTLSQYYGRRARAGAPLALRRRGPRPEAEAAEKAVPVPDRGWTDRPRARAGRPSSSGPRPAARVTAVSRAPAGTQGGDGRVAKPLTEGRYAPEMATVAPGPEDFTLGRTSARAGERAPASASSFPPRPEFGPSLGRDWPRLYALRRHS